MKKIIFTFGLSFAFAASSHSAVLAYWNFNGLSIATASAPGSGGVPTSIPADSGTGNINLSNYGGTVDDFGGSAINAISPAAAEESLSLLASGVSPFPGNGTYIEIATLNFTGVSNLGITYASQRTGTGYNSAVWSFSTDGTNFTSVPAVNPPTSFGLISIDLTSFTALNNAPSVTLRYTLSGATSAAGNNRIDNLQVVSDFVPVPEPTAVFLSGLGFLGILRRRR